MDTPFVIDAISAIRQSLYKDKKTCLVVASQPQMDEIANLVRAVFTTAKMDTYPSFVHNLPSRIRHWKERPHVVIVGSFVGIDKLIELSEDFKVIFSYPTPADFKAKIKEKQKPDLGIYCIPKWWGDIPRRNAPWNPEEDKQLRYEVIYGMSYAKIAERHGRELGGITSRVSKLFGPDFVPPCQRAFDFGAKHKEGGLVDATGPEVLSFSIDFGDFSVSARDSIDALVYGFRIPLEERRKAARRRDAGRRLDDSFKIGRVK